MFMEIVVVIFGVLALIAPIWFVINADYEKIGVLYTLKIASGFYCMFMLVVFTVVTLVGFVLPDKVHNAHRLSDLEDERVYNVLQKFEHLYMTYYWIEHMDGKAGLYYHKPNVGLDIGYYKLEPKNQNSEPPVLSFKPMSEKLETIELDPIPPTFIAPPPPVKHLKELRVFYGS